MKILISNSSSAESVLAASSKKSDITKLQAEYDDLKAKLNLVAERLRSAKANQTKTSPTTAAKVIKSEGWVFRAFNKKRALLKKPDTKEYKNLDLAMKFAYSEGGTVTAIKGRTETKLGRYTSKLNGKLYKGYVFAWSSVKLRKQFTGS